MDLKKILLVDDVVDSINTNLDLMLDYIPELRFMLKFDQKHPDHHLDLWNHTMYALSMSENNFDIRVALLFHDIGKPFSYQEGEIRHYRNHADVSRKITKVILDRLCYDDDWINYICFLIGKHDTPLSIHMINETPDLADVLYKIQYCDALAHNPDKLERRIEYLDKTKKLLLKNTLI